MMIRITIGCSFTIRFVCCDDIMGRDGPSVTVVSTSERARPLKTTVLATLLSVDCMANSRLAAPARSGELYEVHPAFRGRSFLRRCHHGRARKADSTGSENIECIGQDVKPDNHNQQEPDGHQNIAGYCPGHGQTPVTACESGRAAILFKATCPQITPAIGSRTPNTVNNSKRLVGGSTKSLRTIVTGPSGKTRSERQMLAMGQLPDRVARNVTVAIAYSWVSPSHRLILCS